MFLNRGVVIHYHEDLYNQTISGFFLINKACSLSDVLIGDGQRGGAGHRLAAFQFGPPRGLKGADERSHAHTRQNVSDGGGVKTTGTVIDTAAKRESSGGKERQGEGRDCL